jgi:PAS domain S-box-containing protein
MRKNSSRAARAPETIPQNRWPELEAHLSALQGEQDMLRLHKIALQHRQQIVRQNERRMREALRRSIPPRLKMLVESLPSLICHIDRYQRLLYCNGAYTNAFGVTRTAGRYLWEVTGEADYDTMRPAVVRALQGEEVTDEFRFWAPRGQGFLLQVRPRAHG